MAKYDEFQNYANDSWWWFFAYLELGAAISANPKLSVNNSSFSDHLSEYVLAVEQQQLLEGSFLTYGDD